MTADGDPATDGPRWPRSKAIYPTSLRRYQECPHRVRLEYIDKVAIDPPAWDPVLEKGNAVHKIMETIGGHIRRNRPIPDYIRKRAEQLLPASEYAFEALRAVFIEVDRKVEWRWSSHNGDTKLSHRRH